MADKIWMKRMNIPIWIVQLIISLIFTAAAGLALYVVDSANNEGDFGDNLEQALNSAAAIQLSLSIFTIILIISEIISCAIHKLGPVGNIVIQCLKSAVWTFFLIVQIIGAVDGAVSGWAIFLVLVMFLSCMAQLIYGAVIVHRHRKGTLYRGNYALAEGGHAQNTAYYGTAPSGSYAAQQQPNPFSDPSTAPPSYSAPPATTGTYPHSAETAYKPQGTAQDYYGGGAPGAYEMHGAPVRY